MTVLSKLDKMVELQARAYEMNSFDLAQAITFSRTSKNTPFTYFTKKKNQSFILYPILALHPADSGKSCLIILPDEFCLFAGQHKESRGYSYANSATQFSIMDIIKILKIGHYVIALKNNYSPAQEFKGFICEDNKANAIALMEELEKANKSSYNEDIRLNSSDPLWFSLKSIKNKVREQSILNLGDSLEKQIRAYTTWKALSTIIIDMPSVSTSRIMFTTDKHSYSFVYPSKQNPSRKLGIDEKKPEAVEDAHYWLNALEGNSVDRTLSEAIIFFLKKKWFEFSVDGKALKIEIKESKQHSGQPKFSQRTYVEGIPTKQEDIIPFLLSLKERSKEDIMSDIESNHKLSPEMQNIIKKGLYGNITDLEDDRVQINVQIIRHGNRYVLSLAGKEYQVEGGFQTLKKLQAILEGRTKRSQRWTKLEISYGRDAKLFLDVLIEALGESKAIEFYQELKKEDERRKVLSSKTFIDFLNEHNNVTKTNIDREEAIKVRTNDGKVFYVLNSGSGFELDKEGKKHNIENNRTSWQEEYGNSTNEENLLNTIQLILDGKAKVTDYGI